MKIQDRTIKTLISNKCLDYGCNNCNFYDVHLKKCYFKNLPCTWDDDDYNLFYEDLDHILDQAFKK